MGGATAKLNYSNSVTQACSSQESDPVLLKHPRAKLSKLCVLGEYKKLSYLECGELREWQLELGGSLREDRALG